MRKKKSFLQIGFSPGDDPEEVLVQALEGYVKSQSAENVELVL